MSPVRDRLFCLLSVLFMLTASLTMVASVADDTSGETLTVNSVIEEQTPLAEVLDEIFTIGEEIGQPSIDSEFSIPEGIPSVDDIVKWLDEKTVGETVNIEEEMTVESGDSFHIGYGNSYELSDFISITVSEGAKLELGPNFMIQGQQVDMIMENGSVLSVFNNDYTMTEEVRISMDGMISSDIVLYLLADDADGNMKFSFNLHCAFDIDGELNINDIVTIRGSVFDEIQVDIRADVDIQDGKPVLDGIKGEFSISLNLSSLTIRNDYGEFSMKSLVADVNGDVDPEGEDYAVMDGNITMTLEATVGSGEYRTNISYPMEIELNMHMASEDLNSDESFPFYIYMVIEGDLTAENQYYGFDCKDLTIVVDMSIMNSDDEMTLIPTIIGMAEGMDVTSRYYSNNTDMHFESPYLHFVANIPIEIDIETGTATLDRDDMLIEYAFTVNRMHGHLDVDGQYQTKKISAFIDSRDIMMVRDEDKQTGESYLSLNAGRLYVKAYLGETYYDYVRIDAYEVQVWPSDEEGRNLTHIEAVRLDAKGDYIDGSSSSLSVRNGKAIYDRTYETHALTIASGSFSLSGFDMEMNITVMPGASVHLSDVYYVGCIDVENGGSMSGNIKMPMRDDMLVSVDARDFSFKEDAYAYLDYSFGSDNAKIIPFTGFILQTCPDDPYIIHYRVNDDGTGTTEGSTGVFYALVAPKDYALTIEGDTEMYPTYSSVELPTPTSEESYEFVGWFDGFDVYKDSYIMPARDVNMKAVWKGTVQDKDINIVRKVCTITLDCDVLFIDPLTFASLRYMMEDGSISVVLIKTAAANMTIQAQEMMNWDGFLYVSVLVTDASAMTDYSKSIGDGRVYMIEMEDGNGRKTDVGNMTVSVLYNGSRPDGLDLRSYYMNDYGRLESIESTCIMTPEGMLVNMTIPHLSNYVVKPIDPYDGMNIPVAIVLAAVLIGASLIALVVVTRR